MADVVTLGVEIQTTGSQQAAQQLGQFSNAAKGAAGSADSLEDQLRALGATQKQAASAARPLDGALKGIGKAFEDNASGVQNASFQLQDIIVQISGGVDASKALGMQLPQLLGGFGPIGAVVGLAVGALLSFVPAAFGAADSAMTLEDALDKLDSAMQRLNDAQKTQSLQDLSTQYGAQAEAARELLDIQRQIAQIEADRAFRAASTAVVGAMGQGLAGQTFDTALSNALALNRALSEQAAVTQQIADVQSGALVLSDEENEALYARQLAYQELFDQLSEYRLGLREIASQFSISERAAANLVIAMAAVTQADTTEARVSATQNLARAIDEATGGLNMASDEGIALYNSLLDAALAGLDLQNLDLASGISAAASSAAELAAKLGISVDLAARLKAGGYEAPRDVIFDPRDPKFNRLAAEAERLRLSAGTTSPFAPSASKASGGSGGGASADAQEAARLFASTRTEAERYAAELDKVETLYRSGAISGEVYTRAIEDLNEKFDPFTKLVADVADTVENELNSAFASVLKGTADLGDALLSFASNVLAKVAQDLFAQQFAAPIAEGIKTIFSADGNVFNQSGVTAFAKGGVVGGPTVFPFADGVGLMGEAGPEAIMPLSRGSDGRLGVAANGNGAPRITINNYSGQEATASTDSAGNVTIDIGRLVAQDITAGGPAYRAIKSTFGLSNRLQQRG